MLEYLLKKGELDMEVFEKLEKLKQEEQRAAKAHRNYCELIEKGSTFPVVDIVPVLLDILGHVEKEEFEAEYVSLASYFPMEFVFPPYKMMMVGRKNMNDSQEGMTFCEEVEGQISFYKFENMCSNIIFRVGNLEFDYIREFIDRIIDYRIENNLDVLTPEMLEQLKIQFLNCRGIHYDGKDSGARKKILENEN